ncbi:kinesin-like protein KIN-14E [Lingula anatina]|uniref:Kinesin-like protein n=1 Tax=Lingula anatina TaxID=7574 RepID=A0A1S3JJA7_LINAN|nr:kinesin-like protein KIN-14E [Lingula anatina]|eukprot:XP_013410211.1 kinesin-like protein KIN-14E [Lingula anatina]
MPVERVNVHCYFDNDTGQWIKLPIGYEIHSDVIKDFMDIIQETIPDWTNSHDILASLRASNYDPHECISTYFNIGDPVTDPWLKGIVRTKNSAADANSMEQKDKEIEKLKKTIKSLEQQLANSKEELKKSNQKVVSLEDRVSTLEAENKSTNVRLTALQEARPKTAKVVTVEKSSVDPKTARALSESAKNLHKSHIQLKMAVKKHVGEISDLMKKAINGMRDIRSCDSGQSREIEDLRELYRKEALERKLLYNKLQELRGNIRVFARCRYDNRVECSLEFPSDSDIATFNPATQQKKIFSFDKVYSPSSKQTEVFEDTLPIIHSCVDGYNVCILAYGQTGSGKTHTMMGPEHDPGVNIRSIKALLEICKERSDKADYTLKVSLLEIYNENVQDLLSSDVKTLPVQSKGNKVVIPGLTEVEVTSMADIQRVMELGNKNRTTAATKMNSQSSRSHLILKLSVEGLNRKAGTHSSGSLMLCDLAGSERVGKTEAQGQRLVEAAAINKSLTALGQVFSALRASQLHIPYRNSKLTHILQPALGGDAKACLFVAVSPDVRNITETISTLTFGSNARQIALGQAKANVSKRMPKDDDDD